MNSKNVKTEQNYEADNNFMSKYKNREDRYKPAETRLGKWILQAITGQPME